MTRNLNRNWPNTKSGRENLQCVWPKRQNTIDISKVKDELPKFAIVRRRSLYILHASLAFVLIFDAFVFFLNLPKGRNGHHFRWMIPTSMFQGHRVLRHTVGMTLHEIYFSLLLLLLLANIASLTHFAERGCLLCLWFQLAHQFCPPTQTETINKTRQEWPIVKTGLGGEIRLFVKFDYKQKANEDESLFFS